ncbi:hypothetical protein [Bradyrhizobium australafricanum]|uniref:hypothetical protein n=1 Tax=Bradyrhizobium australafricanum TaxID=2821406 RepID=UPI001CE26FD1|nr:hypothetical protein [Bradyrhizobium australafricanum]MCA6105558.1 hypothetical protein [Bradyrhizobium australafricanum]
MELTDLERDFLRKLLGESLVNQPRIAGDKVCAGTSVSETTCSRDIVGGLSKSCVASSCAHVYLR